ncbi:hypothetical protein D3C76_802200 [compost metagenome]
MAATGQYGEGQEQRKRPGGVAAGHAVAGQRVAQDLRAYPGKEVFGQGVAQRGAEQGAGGEDQLSPLPRDQQQHHQQGAEDQHVAEFADEGEDHRHFIERRAAVLLHQGHDPLIEGVQVGIADKQARQNQQAHAGNEHRGLAMAAQAAGGAKPDHECNAAGDDAGFRPEAFGQWQANRRARGPAR